MKKKDKQERPQVLEGNTYVEKTGCGNLYVTINELDKHQFELFSKLGKAGGCASAQCESLGRSISVGLQNDVSIEEYLDCFRGIKCSETPKGTPKYACADAIAKAIETYLENKKGEQKEEKKEEIKEIKE